ncbi:MAG TPA: carboxypeptidase regulatory-like domain-containing protein [Candidatus Acidoferrum sp.]|nr:carboxypeptidase regulatory-like domain-containing protein [Candidatus Acidoferrum sp.]
MSESQRIGIFSVFTFALLFSASSLSAQIITGEITGTVTDQSGAIVAGAPVTAVCPDTNSTRTVTSGAAGEYQLSDLPACVYKVSVSATGFKTTVRNITVAVGKETKADFRLQLGERTDTVMVEAASPLVDYSPGVTNEVDTKAIVDLPTEGRDFKSILAITPGVQRSPGGGFLDVSISGQRSTTNNYLIDGMPNNDRFYGSEVVGQPGVLGIPASVLGNDSIEEFSVQQLPSAEYGVKGGAAVNVVLKSGTNDFHGTAFYFGDYDWLNAKNFFTPQTTPYHNHNYGGTLGGPLLKNRLFFFSDFEGQRNKSVEPYQLAIPTVGDLAQAFANLADPTLNPPGPNQFPLTGNPAGLALLKYYPCATSTPSSGNAPVVSCTGTAASAPGAAAVAQGGFTQTISAPNTDTLSSFKIKIDYTMNSKMQLTGRYVFADSLQSAPLGGYTLPPAPGSGLKQDAFNSIAPTRVQVAGLGWTYTISPSKILDVRFNWNRYAQILDPNNKVNPLSLGVDTGPLNPADFGVPSVYASSVTAGNIGGIFGYPLSTRPTQNYDASTHFTWTKGTHSLKFGGNYDYASTFSLRNRARSSLSSFQTDFPTVLTQLLLGRIDEAARSFGDTSRHLYQPSVGIFFQDEWKVKPRLTVSYGLRWEVNGALGEADKTASNFYPCAAPEPSVCPPGNDPPGLVRVGVGNPRLYNLDLRDFGPRAGLAWDVFGNGRTSLRVGYSMVYDVANFAAISAPYTFQGARAGSFTNADLGVFSVTADGIACPSGMFDANGNCLPGLQLLFEPLSANACYNPTVNTGSPDWICLGPQPGSATFGGSSSVPYTTYGPNPTATPPFNIFGVVPDLKTPRIQYYSLTLQHELFSKNAISIGYFGAHGTNMLLNRSLNNRPVGCWSDLIDPTTISPSNPTGSPYGQLTTAPGFANGNNNPTSIDCRRPFDSVFQDSTGTPLYKYVIQLTNGGFSRYNSMQVTYRQRDWHGLNSIVNFTWSNCIDSNSVNRGGGSTLPISENPFNPASNIGPCDTDVRRNFNTGINYDIPKWSAKSSALGRLGSGWQIGSVATYASGRPWTALASSLRDNSGQDRVYQRPDCNAAPIYNYSDPTQNYITNAAAVFSKPVDGTIGTCGRNAFRGPHFVQWDANLNKITKINERLSMQLRWEVFNVLNHPNLNPTPSSTTYTSGAFNGFSQTPDIAAGNPFLSSGGPRAMQLGLKLIF